MFQRWIWAVLVLGVAIWAAATDAQAAGVYVRFRLTLPTEVQYHVRLGGYIHKPNWYLPRAVIPAGADKDKNKRIKSGISTDWFDLKKHFGKALHGRLNRAGGVAEFPNVTAQIITEPSAKRLRLVIELATAPDEASVIKKFEETFNGDLTSFLVSPDLKKDAKVASRSLLTPKFF